MKTKKIFLVLFMTLIVAILYFSINVNAVSIKGGNVIYFVDTNDWEDIYVYIYGQNSGQAFDWQDSEGLMTDTGIDVDGHNLYSYTVDDRYDNKYDMVIFSSKNNNSQTKDLYYVRENVMFAPYTVAQDDGTYDGEWYIQDKSSLASLVSKAENLDSNIYTSVSYANLTTVLTEAENILDNPYVLVGYYGESEYDTVVLNLQTALDNLILKNKVNLATVSGGNVLLNNVYFEDNETINFNVVPSTGFEIENVTVTKVTGYDAGAPILSNNPEDVTMLTGDENGNYSYNAGVDDLYIDVTFRKKVYTISTTVGELGEITPEGPVKVEYGDNKDFVIKAKKGYVVKSVLVNGNSYTLAEDGTLSLTNITSDMSIVVEFELESFTVTIDGVDYEMLYGSKLSDLVDYNNIITKENYVFKGFQIVGTNQMFDSDSEIFSDIDLETVFAKKNDDSTAGNNGEQGNITNRVEDIANPNTGDSIVLSFIGFGVSLTMLIALLFYRKKKMN